MANTIKGLTVEIGGDTTKLGKALENVNKKSRELSSELGSINKLLKMDPGNTDLLAQKQKVLADAVSNTREKLDKLKEAEKQVQEQFERGEVSEAQVRELQREIIATEKKLDSYENAAKETADTLERLGKEASGAADDIEEVGDESKKTKDETEELGSSLDGTLSTGFKAVTALAAATSAAIVGCVEASHEYRTEMGKLDTAFVSANHSSEAAKKTYKELQSILGETDQAVEAANHLAELTETEEELATWTGDILPGVFAKFGASLPLEGLTEAANETVKVGQVTGAMADVINWVSKENKLWTSALGSNKKALAAFNKSVGEGEAVEDAFSAALAACSTEQERQQIVTKTLTQIYSGASKQYKKTNKDVIEANKANEEWNETLADVGGSLAPVVTDVKKFGAEVLKNAKEPLKDAAAFLSDSLLPALSKFSSWVMNNTPMIKAGIAGVAAAMVTYKVATIAAEVAQKGLKGAILATEVAQKALNLAQAATPWGLAAVAIGAVVTALAVYASTVEEVAEDVNVLTDAERELMAAAAETDQAFRDQQKTVADTAGGITSQMKHVQDLAEELQGLASASGKVKEEDEARAQFILNELNEALGTEYKMVDGVIQKYGDLDKNIKDLIRTKTANALLEANNALYVEALQAEEEALQNLILAEKDYTAQREASVPKIKSWEEELAALRKKQVDGVGILTDSEMMALYSQINNLTEKINKEKELLGEKETAYNKAAENYGNYSNIIANYEEAQTAALEGNYQRAVDILKKKSGNYDNYAEDVDQATRTAIDSLYKEAIDAGIAAERTKRNFENGVDGYTKEMVEEAEKGYEDALDKWATAKVDAESVGKDLGGGLADGMENKRNSLISKAKSIVRTIISAFREEADSHSPSRKMINFGEDMGDGAEIGLENTTPDLLKTARKQVQDLLDTYQDTGVAQGQNVVRGVAERATARNVENFQSFIVGNNSKLDAILKAIEAGQVMVLDSGALVGGTANKYNEALGLIRVLTERGAL